MKIKPLREDCWEFISSHNLITKWEKQKRLFEENIKHPSLNVELLEPKKRGVYSFKIDRKYRALYIIKEDKEAEVLKITNHYANFNF